MFPNPNHTRIRLTVSFNESLVVIVNSSSHSRPRLRYTQSSRCVVGGQHLPLEEQKQGYVLQTAEIQVV